MKAKTLLPPGTLQERVDALEWFHTIDFGCGVVSAGSDDSRAKLETLQIPESLRSLSVLDIGAYDGFFSFEAERRQADRVLAVDTLAWERGDSSGWPCFQLAHEHFESRVATQRCDISELSKDNVGTFDLVLCLGVLYHLRNPLRALERVAEVTSDHLILETHTDMNTSRRPAMVFYERDELSGDPSNWWGPNEAALVGMLRDVGFKSVEIVFRRSLSRRLARAAMIALESPLRSLSAIQQGRVVVHAFK